VDGRTFASTVVAEDGMSDDHDFAIDAEAPEPAGDAAEMPQAPPLVVIEYRRGLSAMLLPPLLILLAAVVIGSYQRQTPIRPIVPASASPTPKAPGRLIMVEGSGTGAVVEPIVARTEKRFGPPAPAVSPAPAPAPVTSADPPRPTPPAEASGPDLAAEAEGPPSPFVPDPPRETPEAKPAPPAGPPALARAEPPEPLPTREQFEAGLRREAEQKKVEMQEMEELKFEARYREIQETYRKAQEDRIPFQKDLRFLVKTLGKQAGRDINALCEQYGRVTAPEIRDAVTIALKRSPMRMTREAKVEMIRRLGLPEPMVLDYLAHELHNTINTRGGPRDQNEVRVRAAQLLLNIPITPPPASTSAPRPAPRAGSRASTKSVAGVAPAPGPGAVRRPQ
jgi:hypothetical protein